MVTEVAIAVWFHSVATLSCSCPNWIDKRRTLRGLGGQVQGVSFGKNARLLVISVNNALFGGRISQVYPDMINHENLANCLENPYPFAYDFFLLKRNIFQHAQTSNSNLGKSFKVLIGNMRILLVLDQP